MHACRIFLCKTAWHTEKRINDKELIARQSTKKFSGYACVRKHYILGNRPSHKELKTRDFMACSNRIFVLAHSKCLQETR